MDKRIMKCMAAGTMVVMLMSACDGKASSRNGHSDSDSDSMAQTETAMDTNGEVAAEEITVVVEPVDTAVFDHSTASGLRYRVIKEGEGKSPTATDAVLVNYEGKFLDGTVFDSSYARNEPISFPLNAVIPGWTEGVQLMKEGSTYEFYIPYQLAYGEYGIPGAIPPKSDLIFKVELLEVQ